MEQETGTNWEPGLPLKQTPTVTLVKLGEIVSKATLALWHAEADRYVEPFACFFLLFHDDLLALLPSSLKRFIADAENTCISTPDSTSPPQLSSSLLPSRC
jgi:hypothetical protein